QPLSVALKQSVKRALLIPTHQARARAASAVRARQTLNFRMLARRRHRRCLFPRKDFGMSSWQLTEETTPPPHSLGRGGRGVADFPTCTRGRSARNERNQDASRQFGEAGRRDLRWGCIGAEGVD